MKLTVTGTLEGVEVRLGRIKRIIDHRKTTGYPPFHPSERWQYITRPDLGKVCPVCAPHNGQIYTGDVLKTLFPYIDYIGNYMAFPRTHATPEAQIQRIVGPCNCETHLLNAAEAFEEQMHREKLGVI